MGAPQITRQTEAVLAAFLSNPDVSLYGLEIGKVARLSGGTLYPLLARLEDAHWVQSEWEDIDPSVAGRRRRRYYRLTGDGERIARQAVEQTMTRLAPAIPRLNPSTG